MRNFIVLLLLLLCSFFSNAIAQVSEDCVDAHILAPTPTLLNNVANIVVEQVLGSGNEPAELVNFTPEDCQTDGYTAQAIDKSYWIAFSAVTNGTLEFMITPEDLGTDYDFALFRGFCPNDPCSEPILCLWRSTLCVDYTPTGAAVDPLGTFGVDPTTNFQLHLDAVQLEEGQNYYLLVENRNEVASPECGVEDQLGFTIDFAGTATVGPLVERPVIVPVQPIDNTQPLRVCQGDLIAFEVTEIPFAGNYDWVTNSTVTDATITPDIVTPNDNRVTIQFGAISGQVCMEIVCPIQSLICWEVIVDLQPNLAATPAGNIDCEAVDLTTRITEQNNGAIGEVAFYTSEADALNNTNPLASSIVEDSGTYWAKKTSPNECSDIVAVDVAVEIIEMTPIEPLQVCDAFYDLEQLAIGNARGADGDLSFTFYENEADALNATNAILPPVIFTTNQYWVRAESQNGGPCFDVQSFDATFEAQPTIEPIPFQQYCGNDCLTPLTLELTDANGQNINALNKLFFATEVEANAGDPTNALAEICQSGNFWVRVGNSETCFDVEAFDVEVFPAPDVADVSLEIDCEFGCVNLANQVFTDRNNLDQADLNYSYFDSEIAANDPASIPLDNLEVCDPMEVWARITYTPSGCFDVAQVTITGIELASATLSGDAQICIGTEASLAIDFTGVAPFTVVYSDGINTFNRVAANNTFREPVSPDSTTTYTLISVRDGNGCLGESNGAATITIEQGPTIKNFSQNCNLTATEFTLTIELEGGDPASYQVTGLDGTLTGSTFTSESIPSGTSYAIRLTDANGCPPTELTGSFSCECNSIVGEMDLQVIQACERAPAIGFYLQGETLEKGDALVFVLHDSPDETLGNVVGFSDVSIFTFDENTMEYGTTYYMSAVITKEDLLGTPILDEANNPCLQVSKGAPVNFYPIPTASVSISEEVICVGEPIDIVFNIQGVGPYDINYFDGEKIANLMAIEDGHTITVRPDFTTEFYIDRISPTGLPDCDRDMVNVDRVGLTVLQIPRVENLVTHCNEEGSMLVLTFDINDGEAGTYIVNGLTGTLTGNQFVSDSIPHNTPYQIEVTDANACPPEVIAGIAECFCTADIMVAIEVAQPVSCRGEKDAILRAEPINGVLPYEYFWSTGESGSMVSEISPGITSVTMTDGNGCEVMDTVNLIEPASITASFNIVPISCVGDRDGGILIVDVLGGTGDYTYSFKNRPFQESNFADNFDVGQYDVAVQDSNGCLWTEKVVIEEPQQLAVDLGGNLVLNVGDSITLKPQINQDQITFEWESNDATLCIDCLNPVVKPTASERYKIIVTNSAGCVVSEEVLVQVQNNRRVFVPNAFSPNGDGSNDRLRPFSSTEVSEIAMFRIYTRWGELVYEHKDMSKESSGEGWDGEIEGRKAPAGVYLYYLEVSFIDGNSSMMTGDVTLWR